MSVSAAERHGAGRVVLESYSETGFNYRMTDIQAAVGLAQLRRLDTIVARRRAVARPLPGTARGCARPGYRDRPAPRDHELPVVLGAVAGRLPGRPQRAAVPV
ncbi:MAG: DegT/DnrJ/EryC1/StrS family aminotransferase [Mycobacterium leprae]